MNRAVVCAAAVMMVGSVVGCTQQVSPAAPRSQERQQPGDNSGDASRGDEGQGGLAFGQTHHGQIDKTVRRSEPFTFNTSEYAAPRGGARAWGVELTFVNNTDRPFSPVMFHIGATVDGNAVEEVYDTDSGYSGLLTAPPVAPGRSMTVPVAYLGDGVKHEVTMAKLDFSESATFTD